MQLLSLINDSFLSSASVLCIYRQDYPLLFIAQWLDSLKKKHGLSIETIDLATTDLSTFYARASVTFLGSSSFYWLANCGSLESKKRNELFAYLSSYQGPHKLWFYNDVSVVQLAKKQTVELPMLINEGQCKTIATFLYGQEFAQRMQRLIVHLYKTTEIIDLDQVTMLLHYAAVTGSDYAAFVAEWLPQLITSDKSLFTLSQYFFAKNIKKFFPCWASIKNDYSEQFWIVFWSEQLFKGAYVVEFMQAKKFADAKAMAFRLPFSLMQQDWQKNDAAELGNAHDFLYKLDHAIKNGGDSYGLDLFFSKFMLGEFSNKR